MPSSLWGQLIDRLQESHPKVSDQASWIGGGHWCVDEMDVLALAVASLWRSYGPAEVAAMVGEVVVRRHTLCPWYVSTQEYVEKEGR